MHSVSRSVGILLFILRKIYNFENWNNLVVIFEFDIRVYKWKRGPQLIPVEILPASWTMINVPPNSTKLMSMRISRILITCSSTWFIREHKLYIHVFKKYHNLFYWLLSGTPERRLDIKRSLQSSKWEVVYKTECRDLKYILCIQNEKCFCNYSNYMLCTHYSFNCCWFFFYRFILHCILIQWRTHSITIRSHREQHTICTNSKAFHVHVYVNFFFKMRG